MSDIVGKFPKYEITEARDGAKVSVCEVGTGLEVAVVSQRDAETLIVQRNGLVTVVEALAIALNAAAPIAFKKLWYGDAPAPVAAGAAPGADKYVAPPSTGGADVKT